MYSTSTIFANVDQLNPFQIDIRTSTTHFPVYSLGLFLIADQVEPAEFSRVIANGPIRRAIDTHNHAITLL